MTEKLTRTWITGSVLLFLTTLLSAEAQRFRLPAPAEDRGPLLEFPVFGRAAGHEGTDATLRVMEWVAKRTWHGLGLPYERKDFTGPPAMQVTRGKEWVEIEGTVADGGVPLRNQVIRSEVEQQDKPLLILLRATDAFGEVLVELDLRRGRARAFSVTVSRSMVGGRCHSSPMPEQSNRRVIRSSSFPPPPPGVVELAIRTRGKAVRLRAGGEEIFAFEDPDPAAGKFGFGSTGRMRVRDVQQWELITPREKKRREECWKEMHEFARTIDRLYPGDVRARNLVETWRGGLLWTWRKTGATALLRVQGPRVTASVRSGLYGNRELVSGVFPEILVVDGKGVEYLPDPDRKATLSGDPQAIRMRLPLRSAGGKTADADVRVKLTVQTVWFWTIRVEGVEPARIRATLELAPEYSGDEQKNVSAPEGPTGLVPIKGTSLLRHDSRRGFFVKAIEPGNTVLGSPEDRPGAIALSTSDRELRLATVVLPAQPLNLTGFQHRMVHYIRYPEGPVQHWRRRPSPQEYPTNVDLARYAAHGTDAMVWHHTWLSSDFRDREGFIVHDDEMRRAMKETHRLGMKMIGYLGIVPGRNPLLRFDDLVPLGGSPTWGGYTKNWDLQDQTFYHVAGRYPEFIAWMADYWCKEYDIDGFYLDGGAFGLLSRGPLEKPLYPEDAGLSLDELQQRSYWRVKKVLELNGAGFGLEPWNGLNWMLNGFYDCMMIGESFQEAPPDYYRNGHNALLTGCTVKMYGMRKSSQNPYNIAMAAVNMSDIQVCSGNGAWGDDPDTTDTWERVRPLWDLLESIDWDRLVEARPWYGQELVSGEGFFAGNYTGPERALVFLANRTETPGRFDVRIDRNRLPDIDGDWHLRYCLGREGEIGFLGDGRLQVELPALHDGPVGIELVARKGELSGRGTSLPDSGIPRPREKYRPTVEGKKLLHFRGPVQGDDGVAFDGVITGGPLPFYRKIEPEKLEAWTHETAAREFGRHTDNFYLCYSFPGKTPAKFDWYDDITWIVENWRLMARAAKQARFRGICFDTEYYEGLPLFGYRRMRQRESRSLEEYRAQVRRQAAAIQRAVNEEFPDVTILVLFGYSGSFCPVPQHPVSRRENYTLLSAFVDGLLSECGREAAIFDMHEQSFSFREAGSFARARALMTEVLPETSAVPDRYRRHHRAGFSFWADCWGNRAQGRAIDTEDFTRNYYTPEEMARALHHALAYSDGYVWMWPGGFDWWGRTVKTVDEEGREVQRALPEEYLQALRMAHRPDLLERDRRGSSGSLPPQRRHTWRVLPAWTQEGFTDEETFGDLATTHETLADLPLRWKFRLDREDAGHEKGWQDPRHDDRRWETLRIREFWEAQGHSPYDGAAWYRLAYTPPERPAGRRVCLAFGGVSDEATVWVNGKRLHASRYGENIRHQRFLVDVTEQLGASPSGKPILIAVRVWNTGWGGGIWKGVRLLAERPDG